MTHLHADITKKVRVHAAKKTWQDTPTKGIQQIRLDLIDDVKEVSTSLLKFAPGTMAKPQMNSGGQEFLVLEGIFQNELGSYPEGSYVRLPPGSKHSIQTENGTVLFMKSWQFDPLDRRRVNLDTHSAEVYSNHFRPGVRLQNLFSDQREHVRMEHWPALQRIELQPFNGLELMVTNGSYDEADAAHKRYSWLRLPPGESLKVTAGKFGARVLVKEGHLVHSVPGREALEFPVTV